MTTSFDRWEKDPFFSVAEEVQDSADRMESAFRRWIYARKEDSTMWASEELGRDLRTAVGTTKWQLEEFERAVGLSNVTDACGDAKERHREFILAIQDHISRIANTLKDASPPTGNTFGSSWVRLDEGECNELALFLSAKPASVNNINVKDLKKDASDTPETSKESTSNSSTNFSDSSERRSSADKDKCFDSMKTANRDVDWKIAISDNDPHISSDAKQPRKAHNWWRNLQQAGSQPCSEKSKICGDSPDEHRDKQHYGWYGAVRRQIQRSQYQMQYSRQAQVALSVFVLLFFLVLICCSAL